MNEDEDKNVDILVIVLVLVLVLDNIIFKIFHEHRAKNLEAVSTGR
ncbi:MAG: hypothetical protein PVH43_12065 [Desulfobacterales bacterium]|jgi:hypothetical protein